MKITSDLIGKTLWFVDEFDDYLDVVNNIDNYILKIHCLKYNRDNDPYAYYRGFATPKISLHIGNKTNPWLVFEEGDELDDIFEDKDKARNFIIESLTKELNSLIDKLKELK